MALVAIDWRPTRGMLRLFGLVTALFLAGLGAWAFFRDALLWFGLAPDTARMTAYVLWAVAAVVLPTALAAPRAIWLPYAAMNAAAFPIGFVVSHVILFIIFYGIFMPVAMVFRLIGRDALHRGFDSSAETYWQSYEAQPPPQRYFRQF